MSGGSGAEPAQVIGRVAPEATPRPAAARRRSAAADSLVLGAALVDLPVHAQGALVEHLQAVHADVAPAGGRVARDDGRQRDVAAAVVGPALQDGQRGPATAWSVSTTSWQGPPCTRLGAIDRNTPSSSPARFSLSTRERGMSSDSSASSRVPSSSRSSTPSAQAMRSREPKALISTGHVVAGDVLEQQGHVLGGGPLRHAVGDLGDLQLGADRDRHPSQLAA